MTCSTRCRDERLRHRFGYAEVALPRVVPLRDALAPLVAQLGLGRL